MLKGIQHTGFVTNDIKKTYDFYTGLPGVKIISDIETHEGDLIDKLNNYKNAKVKMFVIQIGGDEISKQNEFCTGRVEFIEWIEPRGKKLLLENNAGGNAHIALVTDSIEDDYKSLTLKGVEFSCEPLEVDFGEDLKGVKVTYFKDPDGRPVELMQFPATV